MSPSSARADRIAADDPIVAELADRLSESGFPPAAPIGFRRGPGPRTVRLLLAAWRAGLVPVLYHHRWPESVLARARAATGCSIHLDENEDSPAIVDDGQLPWADPQDVLPGSGPTATAGLVCFSSGTTGKPRACLHSRHGIELATETTAAHLGLGPGSAWGLCLATDHIGGAMAALRAQAAGATLAVWTGFDPTAVNQAIDAGEIDGLSLVPVMLRRLLDDRRDRSWPPTLRCLLVGGDGLDPALARRCAAAGRWPCRTYGQTETAAAIAIQDPAGEPTDDCGRLLPGIEVRIRDGRLLLRGERCARGLIRAPDRVVGLADRDGWYDSGDLASLDPEGRLHILGRADDRIVTGGETVDPLVVEGLLAEHPGIAECRVFGLPDSDWGECLAAAVTPGTLDPAALDRWCRDHLPAHLRPRRWLLCSTLPRGATGKVDRRRLRTLLTDAAGPE